LLSPALVAGGSINGGGHDAVPGHALKSTLAALYLRHMRRVSTILICLLAGACSTLPPPDVEPPPDETQLKAGINQAITESHFARPVEVTDVMNAPASSTQPWMVCMRSASLGDARRPTYAVFFGKDGNGKYGQYVRSRYSVFAENCETQAYHPFADTGTPAGPSPSPAPEPKKHRRHNQ
jgi:hypothetical protein